MRSFLELDEVSFVHPSLPHPVLHRVTMRLRPGELAMLVGSSGSGKTALFRLVLGLEQPTLGAVRVAGRDIHRLRATSLLMLRQSIGYKPQDPTLVPWATVSHNVALPLQVLGLPRRETRRRVHAMLACLDLEARADVPAAQLSGGEQQRVAFARTLISDPPLVLLDEPFAHLDASTRARMCELVNQARERGATVVLATKHASADDSLVPDRKLHLARGHLVEEADTFDDTSESTAREVA